MRQKVSGGFPSNRDNMCQDTLSPSNLAPAAFNTNQNGTLCLPLLSEDQKIIWVHSNQINIQVDKAAELDKAFSRFPYVTQRQTISLAERCHLHPDQVKVWFMAQRLCYGISWDSKDIHEVRRKMLGCARFKRKRHKSAREKEIVKKPKLSRQDKSDAKEDVDSNTHVIEKEQLSTTEDKLNTERKGKSVQRKTVRRMEQTPRANVTKEAQMVWPKTKAATSKRAEALLGSSSKPLTTHLLKTNGENGFAVQDESLDRSPSVTFQAHSAALETCLMVEKHEELQATSHLLPLMHNVTQESQISNPPDCSSIKKQLGWKNKPTVTSRIKTPKQLAIMKMEFAKYQYLNDKQYKDLSLLTGVPRHSLVQWFNKMRKIIKKRKPRWLSVEQHYRAVANVAREQFLRKCKNRESSKVKKLLRRSPIVVLSRIK